MNTGYYSVAEKASEGGPTYPVPPQTWTSLGVVSLPEGPSILNAQLYAKLPTTRPKDIMARWRRVLTNDTTARTPLVVGTLTDWSASFLCIEFAKPDESGDLELQLWHNASAPITVTTTIRKGLNPGEYIAQRIQAAT